LQCLFVELIEAVARLLMFSGQNKLDKMAGPRLNYFPSQGCTIA
jgi:hypothetical protein